MGEIDYTYRHPDFNLHQAYYYTLVLQVNSSDFTYAAFYGDKLMALVPHCALNELAEPQGMADELFANFKNIVVGVDADAFTLVPLELFREDRVADFARFLDVKAQDNVLAQQLDKDNFIIYKTTRTVFNAIEKFDLNRCVYSGKGWINAIAGSNAEENTLYVNIEEGVAEFLYFKNGKVRLYNTFKYNTADDLAYAASLAFKETGLHQREMKLSISGLANQNDAYKTRLADFFLVVETNTTKIAELPDELSSDQLLKLSALLLCVSSEAL